MNERKARVFWKRLFETTEERQMREFKEKFTLRYHCTKCGHSWKALWKTGMQCPQCKDYFGIKWKNHLIWEFVNL